MAARGPSQADMILHLLYAIFGSLFYLEQLGRCAAPLHIWMIMWWIGIVAAVAWVAADQAGYSVGMAYGMKVMFCILLYHVLGVAMYIYSLYESPECIPASIFHSLMTFFSGATLAVVVWTVTYFIVGNDIAPSTFTDEKTARAILREIRNGKRDADDYIAKNPAIDNYTLFPFEKFTLKDMCTEGVSAPAHSDCSICLEAYGKNPSLIAFPICNHIFHDGCLERWLERKPCCPVCRRGARSSLYRKVARSTMVSVVAPPEKKALSNKKFK